MTFKQWLTKLLDENNIGMDDLIDVEGPRCWGYYVSVSAIVEFMCRQDIYFRKVFQMKLLGKMHRGENINEYLAYIAQVIVKDEVAA